MERTWLRLKDHYFQKAFDIKYNIRDYPEESEKEKFGTGSFYNILFSFCDYVII